MSRSRDIGGFTLIEVLVALVIVAFGIGALLTTLTSSADNVTFLRDKSFAEWIALNRLSELRLTAAQPPVGSSNGEVEYAGSKWRWTQEVIDPGIAGIRRVDVSVSHVSDDPARSSEGAPALATAFGFLGQALAPVSAFDPDWSPSSPQNPGGPGT